MQKKLNKWLFIFGNTIRQPNIVFDSIVKGEINYEPLFLFIIQVLFFSLLDIFQKGITKDIYIWIIIDFLVIIHAGLIYLFLIKQNKNFKVLLSSLLLIAIPNLLLFPIYCIIMFYKIGTVEILLDRLLLVWEALIIILAIRYIYKYSFLRSFTIWLLTFLVTISIGAFLLITFNVEGRYYKGKGVKEVSMDESNLELYYNKAVALGKEGRLKEALQIFESLADYSPNDCILSYDIGLTYAALGNYKRAEINLKRAIELNPKYINSYNALGQVYFNKKDYDNAQNYWEKAQQIDPDIEWVNRKVDVLHNHLLSQ